MRDIHARFQLYPFRILPFKIRPGNCRRHRKRSTPVRATKTPTDIVSRCPAAMAIRPLNTAYSLPLLIQMPLQKPFVPMNQARSNLSRKDHRRPASAEANP
jgi:hypothetical protein